MKTAIYIHEVLGRAAAQTREDAARIADAFFAAHAAGAEPYITPEGMSFCSLEFIGELAELLYHRLLPLYPDKAAANARLYAALPDAEDPAWNGSLFFVRRAVTDQAYAERMGQVMDLALEVA